MKRTATISSLALCLAAFTRSMRETISVALPVRSVRLLNTVACFAFLVLGFQQAKAQGIAVDNTSSAGGPNANVTSLTWSHTVGSGTNRILIVGVSLRDGNLGSTSVTYGGTALTQIGFQIAVGNQNRTEMWRLIAPTTGTANIVVTITQPKRIVGGAISFTGVDQTTPLGTFVSATNQSTTASVTVSSAVGEVVVDTVTANGDANSLSVGAGQTERWNTFSGVGVAGDGRQAGSTEPGASSVTMSWALGVSKPSSIGAVALKAGSAAASDLTITKSHSGNFTQGQVGATYSIKVTNSGTANTSGTVTVTDTLPAGLTATAIAGTNWTCVLGTLTCTRSNALVPGASYATITLTVDVANNAPASVTNTANVSGGGEIITTNDTANDPTTINGLPDLTITKTHSGNFTEGQTGATYSIIVTNSGLGNTSGTVTVTDILPAGLTASAIAGTNWTCVLGTLTCTRSNALVPGASYATITLTVDVAINAPASVTNTVNVSGGGEIITTNDTANDPTTINEVPDLTITKTHSGNFTQGQTGATYSIRVTNSGLGNSSGTVTVTDTLPAGLTATAIAGTNWTCVLGTLTCTRSNVLVAGASYPAITLTVDVALTAPNSVTNSATVSGGGETDVADDTADDPTTIVTAAAPAIDLVKSVNPNGVQVPGTELTYTIVYTNAGGQPANNFIVVDPNVQNVDPLERAFRNVDFKVGSMTSSPGTTGLVATFEYSNDGGATWTYTPASGGGGAPAGYDHSVTNLRWQFTGSLSHLAPQNTGDVGFTVRIR